MGPSVSHLSQVGDGLAQHGTGLPLGGEALGVGFDAAQRRQHVVGRRRGLHVHGRQQALHREKGGGGGGDVMDSVVWGSCCMRVLSLICVGLSSSSSMRGCGSLDWLVGLGLDWIGLGLLLES